jgi:hypothetical protein
MLKATFTPVHLREQVYPGEVAVCHHVHFMTMTTIRMKTTTSTTILTTRTMTTTACSVNLPRQAVQVRV